MTQISLHDCSGIRVRVSAPYNGNQISIEIQGKTPVELTMFDLPEKVTRLLMDAFADEETIHRKGKSFGGKAA